MTMTDRRRALMSVAKKSRLPREYQEVEYLKGDGSAYIDTLYKPNNNTKISIKLITNRTEMPKSSDPSSTYPNVYGVFESGKHCYSRWSYRDVDKTTISASLGNASHTNVYLIYDPDYEPDFVIQYDIYENNGHVALYFPLEDAEYISQSKVGEFQSSVNLPLFCQYLSASGYVRFFKGRISSFKIYESNIPQRDFVPCYRKSDSKPGMYDLVNNVFYTNQGTGEFDVGGDV